MYRVYAKIEFISQFTNTHYKIPRAIRLGGY